jgi:hypothetical protein
MKFLVGCERQSADGCKAHNEAASRVFAAGWFTAACAASFVVQLVTIMPHHVYGVGTVRGHAGHTQRIGLSQALGLPVAQQLRRRQDFMAYALLAYARCYLSFRPACTGGASMFSNVTWFSRRWNPCMCLCTLGAFVLQLKHGNKVACLS